MMAADIEGSKDHMHLSCRGALQRFPSLHAPQCLADLDPPYEIGRREVGFPFLGWLFARIGCALIVARLGAYCGQQVAEIRSDIVRRLRGWLDELRF